MSLRSKLGGAIPSIPRVTSPSPTTPDRDTQEYAGPTTRSRRKAKALAQQQVVELSGDDEPHRDADDLRRPRTASRSPIAAARRTAKTSSSQADPKHEHQHQHQHQHEPSTPNGKANGAAAAAALNGKAHGAVSATADGHLLAPPSSLSSSSPPRPAGSSFWSWRDFSRSPSPLGLIPIHRHWRAFVHQHEVPRKALHVSIGFFVVWLYSTGTQTSSVPPYLMGALVPITTVDWLRHRYAPFNRVYVRVLGALMRESEYAGWNGVIFYLLGAWIVLYFFPKDVGVMSVLLLSWCDTAASTFGRLWGRYTPRLRRGKSLAGSLAACLMGVATSYFFYGWLVPAVGPMPGDEAFMFTGSLSLPRALCDAVGLSDSAAAAASVGGSLALGIVSALYGIVASASEVVDLFGWDDNLTIPVLSGIGMFGFLKLFGQ